MEGVLGSIIGGWYGKVLSNSLGEVLGESHRNFWHNIYLLYVGEQNRTINAI